MKINKIILSTLILTIGFFASSVAIAEQEERPIKERNPLAEEKKVDDVDINKDENSQSKGRSNSNALANSQDKSEEGSESSSEKKDDDKKEDSNSVGESHRSAVATFVQSLLKVADREGGIGAQVKVIANAQNDSQEVTTEAISEIEKRGGFKTFFIGSDYKNIGVIRSQMVITKNQIDQLNKLIDQATDQASKTELQAQIKVLEEEQVKLDAFIKKNESKFSLFGWFFK